MDIVVQYKGRSFLEEEFVEFVEEYVVWATTNKQCYSCDREKPIFHYNYQ